MQLKPATQAMLEELTDFRARQLVRIQLEDERRQGRKDRHSEFGFADALRMMADPGGLVGAPREYAQETARLAARAYTPHSMIVPLHALGERTLTAATATAGAELVGIDVEDVVDLLRPYSVTARAGANVVPNLKADTRAPYTDADISLTWQATETSEATPASGTVASTLMQPKNAIAVVPMTKQLLVQSPLAEPWSRRMMLRGGGQAMDYGVLNASGASGEPDGILNNGNISTETGASIAWANILAMKANAADINAEENAIGFIGTVAVRQLLEGRERGTNGDGFIWENGKMANCPAYACTLMPADTLLSGPFERVTVGLWGPGIEISINPYHNFQAGILALRVELHMDIALSCDPAAFTAATSVS